MSWDVVLMSIPKEMRSISEVPDDFSPILGPKSEILPLLSHLIPSIDLSDPTWGLLDGPDYSIEFNIGKKEPIATIMLHVRGSESALEPIEHLCRNTGWRAFDCSDGEFIDFSTDPGQGLRQWQSFRDKVVVSAQKDGSEVIIDPKIPGARADAIITSKGKHWWKFWK